MKRRQEKPCGEGKTWIGCVAVGAVLLSTAPASAQIPNITTPRVRVIEWSLPADVQGDARPGALVVDTLGHDKDRMWFVTRVGQPHLYRLEFPHSLMRGLARWTSWQLDGIFTGGIRRLRGSYDRRFIFIRTISTDPSTGAMSEAVERVDTDPTKCPGSNCQTTVYKDGTTLGLDVSDVAVDDQNHVFTTHSPNSNPTQSFVQRLTPGTGSAAPQVTRWLIPGSGAGLCGAPDAPDDWTQNSPCISGIAVHPSNRNLIYFSEPTTNTIAELNIGANPPTVRRWSLQTLSNACVPTATILCTAIFGPRQLQIDKRGKVWVVTGSGDLISLDPCTNKMTAHELPDNVLANPFGLAPDDDAIGYTASDVNKVGMLIPKAHTVSVQPSQPAGVSTAPVVNFSAHTADTICNSNTVGPVGKTVAGQVTKKDDGTFLEAKVNTNVDNQGNPSSNPDHSLNPLGITPVKAKAQGTFFVTIGDQDSGVFDRVAFVRLPIREKIKFPRDDDDENDGDDSDHGWHGWHGHADDNDDDDDGVDNGHDQHDKDERNARDNDTTADDGVLAGGASKDYTIVTTPTSLAIVALTTADDPLAQIGIDIYDSLGMLVARSLPTPGLAAVEVLLPAPGTYTARVRNYGALPFVQTPNLFIRELWVQ